MAYQYQHGNLEKRQQQLVCILNQITQSKYIGVSQQVCSFHPWAGLETSQWEALLVHLWCCWPFWSLVKEIERVVCLEASFGYDRVLGCGHWRIRIFWLVLLLTWVDSTVDWWIEVCTRFTLGRATGLQTLSPKVIILKFRQCVQQSAFVLGMSGDELDRQDTDLMASTDLLSYAICVSNRPPFSPHMSVPNKQMAYPAAATWLNMHASWGMLQ